MMVLFFMDVLFRLLMHLARVLLAKLGIDDVYHAVQ